MRTYLLDLIEIRQNSRYYGYIAYIHNYAISLYFKILKNFVKKKGDFIMLKKSYLLIGVLIATLLTVSACSDGKEATSEGTETKQFIALSGDTVSKMSGCVLASQYQVGDDIIFRMDAIDPETNKQITDAKLQVHLSTGETLDMAYGPHAEDKFWTVNYTVTPETPTGQLSYHITAEAGNTKTEYRPFNVAPSLITIVAADPNAEAPAPEPEKEPVDLSTVKTNQTIDLIAKNFTFTNAAGEDTFYVKAGEKVTINLKTDEGAHGFDIEGLDASIKESNGTVTFTPSEAGEFPIICNLFCGAGHEAMKSTLVVIK